MTMIPPVSEALPILREDIEFHRSEAAKARRDAASRRETAEMLLGQDDKWHREAHRLAEQMEGRRMPFAGPAERAQQAKREANIAAKRDADAERHERAGAALASVIAAVERMPVSQPGEPNCRHPRRGEPAYAVCRCGYFETEHDPTTLRCPVPSPQHPYQFYVFSAAPRIPPQASAPVETTTSVDWQARAESAERTVASVAAMLGWGNVPPRATLEMNLAAMKGRLTAVEHERDKLRQAMQELQAALPQLASAGLDLLKELGDVGELDPEQKAILETLKRVPGVVVP